MNCIDSLLQLQNEYDNLEFSISSIYGDDSDGTSSILLDKLDSIKNRYNTKISTKKITFTKRLDGMQRLTVLRNAFLYINNLEDYDYILSIDTDVMFDTTAVIKLLVDMQNPNLDNPGIIAPKIVIENFNAYGNSYFYDTLAFKIQDKNFLHTKPYIPIKLFGKDKFKNIINVDSVGSFYLAKTNIFTKYGVKYGTYLRNLNDLNTIHPQRKYESEQVVMCEDTRQKTPYKIYVDMNATVFHIDLPKYGIPWH